MEITDPIQRQLIAARRNQILDAATQVFAEKGFHKATIRAIAQTAGIADGTIYNYFKNKNDLLFGILDRLNESENREADFAQGLAAGDLRAFMAAYMRQRLELLWPNADVFRAILPEVIANPELRQIYHAQIIAPTLEMAEQQFQKLAAAGLIRPVDVPLAVRAMAGQFFGLLMLYLWGDEKLAQEWEALPDVLASMIYDGLKPE